MSELIISKNALMHIESEFESETGQKAECQARINPEEIKLIILYQDKYFAQSIAYLKLSNDQTTSGQLLSQFTKDAIKYFLSSK